MASKSGYKKVLFKKLSGLTILLIILVLGVFAVIFNKFYLSPRAMNYFGDGGSYCYIPDECVVGKCIKGWWNECARHGYRSKVWGVCTYKSLFPTARRC